MTKMPETLEMKEPTFGTHHQPPALLGPPINRFNNIDQLLLIFQHPIQLVIIARSKITHHVLISEKEHQRDRIVQFVHLLEVGDLVEVTHVDDSEVFHPVGNALVVHVSDRKRERKGRTYGRELRLGACSLGPSRGRSG